MYKHLFWKVLAIGIIIPLMGASIEPSLNYIDENSNMVKDSSKFLQNITNIQNDIKESTIEKSITNQENTKLDLATLKSNNITENKEKPSKPASLDTAFLSNNLLNLYFNEQNSDVWQYQWASGQWGESCYHEHFGVYTGNAATTYESENFIVDIPFANPGGGPGTISATLHYSNVQVARKITLISGDIRFFEIEYTIKNLGSSNLNDVRFFETIDFDIPTTSDCTDDYAWYDSNSDYVVVNDNEFFQNSITGNLQSDRHGIDYWYDEIYNDWDDGNLNNNNNYGPGDPAIGMQYNLGNLAPGGQETVILTIWFGEPTGQSEPEFISLTFNKDNKVNQQTTKYPNEYNVFRNSFIIDYTINNFNPYQYKVIFDITNPDNTISSYLAEWGGHWGPAPGVSMYPNNFHVLLWPFLSGVGEYTITAKIQKKDGSITYDVFGDDEPPLTFYLIYLIPNELNNAERKAYLYDVGGTRDLDGAFYGNHIELTYYESTYFLNPFDKHIFDIAMAIANGDTSETTTAEKLWEAVQNIIYYYNPSQTSGVPEMFSSVSISDAVQASKGIEDQYVTGQCLDYAHGLCALMRAIGIPARTATGIYQPGAFSYHAWCEAYIPEAPGDDQWYVYDAMDYTQEPHTPEKDLQFRALDPDKRSTFFYGESSTEVAVGNPNWAIDNGQISVKNNPLRVVRDNSQANDILFEKNENHHYGSYIRNGFIERDNHNYSVNLSLDKEQVRVGESVTANITVVNNGDIEKNFNLTFCLYVYDFRDDGRDGLSNFIYSYDELITIPSNESFERYLIFVVNDTIYPKDTYLAVATIKEINNESTITSMDALTVLPAFDINVSTPQVIKIDESILLNISICNSGLISIQNISIKLTIPSVYNTSDPLVHTIPYLEPDVCEIFTWNLTPSQNISCLIQQLRIQITSDNGGNYSDYFSLKLIDYPKLFIVNVSLPSKIQNESVFPINATIENLGELPVFNLQCELCLPPELSTNESLIQYIGTLEPHANVSVTWNATASQTGTSLVCILANSSNDNTSKYAIIDIFNYDHEISLSVDQIEIAADGDLHEVNMTIYNFGEINDSILFQYFVTNQNISFGIYDGEEHIIYQPVIVPANESKTLTLKITPGFGEYGIITIYAVSELDPSATDSVNLNVTFRDVGVKQITEPSVPLSRGIEWITYGGENTNSIGLTDGGTFEGAIRLTPNELMPYNGWKITQVKFHHGMVGGGTEPATNGNMKIYGSGTPTTPGSLLVSEPFNTPTFTGWFWYNFSNPVIIDASQDIWFSIEVINTNAGEHPLGVDDGPAIDGKGDWVAISGSWSELQDYGLDYNWNHMVGVENDTGGITWLPGTYSIEAIVKNYGSHEESFVTNASIFKINSKDETQFYQCNYSIENLSNQMETIATFENVTFEESDLGNYRLEITTQLMGDMDQANDKKILLFTIYSNYPPQINDNTPSYGNTNDQHTFNATIIDYSDYVSGAWVEYWYGEENHINLSMNNVVDNYWEKTIIIDNTLDTLHYIILAQDNNNIWNNTGIKNVSIYDNDEPTITNVQSIPSEQLLGGYINISADVVDNIEVNEVYLFIQYPDNIIENFSITENKTDDTYYCNNSYDQPGIYTFHIWAEDTSDNTNISSDYSFEICVNNPPYEPNTPSPTDGATGVDVNTDLSWSGGDPDGDPVTYDVYFGITSPPPKIITNQSASTYDPGTMTMGTLYYWKIVAWDNYGASAVGPTWNFTTKFNNPPYEPNTPSPTDGATGVDVNTDLSWSGGDPDGNSVTYDVYFGITSPPPKVISNQSGNVYYPGTLSYNTTYYWKIVSWDSYSNSTSGSIWHFTTEFKIIYAFLLGLITDKNDSENYTTFKARLLFYIDLDNFDYQIFKNSEQLMVSKVDSIGYIGPQFIIGVYNTAVITEQSRSVTHHYKGLFVLGSRLAKLFISHTRN